MKKDIFPWLRRCQFPLLLLMSVMPLLLQLLCIHAPDSLSAAWVLFAAFTAAGGLCLAVPGSKRMPTAVLCCAAMLVISLIILPFRSNPLLLLLPCALSALLFFSFPLAMRRYEAEIPPFIYFIGIAIHTVTQFLHHYFSIPSGISPYEPIAPALTASLIGYLLLLLLSLNRISLDNASLARHRIPAGMRGVNTTLTIAFIAVSLLLTMTPAVIRGVTMLWRALGSAVSRLVLFLLSLLPSASDPGLGAPGGMEGMLPAGEAAPEPGAFAVLLEKIASVLTMIILIVGVVVIMHLLFKLLMRLVRHVAARLRAYMSAAAAEYEDEITDTREDGAQREIRFLRRARRLAAQHDGTPGGRIRSTYARLLLRHPKWTASSTARENLPADAAALYERARYSDHPVTGEDAERFAGEIRRL